MVGEKHMEKIMQVEILKRHLKLNKAATKHTGTLTLKQGKVKIHNGATGFITQ